MKRLIAMGLCAALLAAGARVYAEDGQDAGYVGGSVPGIKEGTAGKLDMTAANGLKFQAGATELSIPYGQMSRIEYREQNRFRLGVVGTIVVGIVKAREKVRSVTITWRDDKDAANVVTLEMGKEKAMASLDVLRARTHIEPSVCEAKFNASCAKPQ
jgi:hypothetical protein